MNDNFINHTIRRWVIFVLSLALLVGILIWISSHSFVSIDIVGGGQGKNSSVEFIKQNSGESSTTTTTNTTFKKLLGKGSYELYVTQDNKSYVALIKIGGFLGSKKVTATILPEKERSFVGNEPDSCMYYDEVLYSADCGSSTNTLKVHTPATANTPTFVTTAPYEGMGIESLLSIGTKPYLLGATNGDSANHVLFSLDEQLSLRSKTPLPDLVANAYVAKEYREGFIVYDQSFSDIRYYSSLDSNPEQINIVPPSNDNLSPTSFTTYNMMFGILYNSLSDEGDRGGTTESSNNSNPLEGSSEFVLYQNNSHKSVELHNLYSSAVLCGNNKLCLVSGSQLDIYDISKEKPKKLYSIQDVQNASYVQNKIIVITSTKVIGLDSGTFSGAIQYSFGKYKYCGFGAAQNGYVICILNPQNQSSALFISPSMDDTSSIDKKALALSEDPNVTSVSTYKNYVYISPNLGQLIYRPDLQGYGYDPAIIRSADEAINKRVREVGIDTSKYMVINPYN